MVRKGRTRKRLRGKYLFVEIAKTALEKRRKDGEDSVNHCGRLENEHELFYRSLKQMLIRKKDTRKMIKLPTCIDSK